MMLTMLYCRSGFGSVESNVNLKRGAINNSLLDLTDNYNIHPGFTQQEKPTRRGSVGSLGRCQTEVYSGIWVGGWPKI